MSGTRIRKDETLLSRALLLPIGPDAETIAHQTLALSARWLGVEPPVRVIEPSGVRLPPPSDPDQATRDRRDRAETERNTQGESEEPVLRGFQECDPAAAHTAGRDEWAEAVGRACDELAAASWVVRLRASGYTVAGAAHLHIWLIVDTAQATGPAENSAGRPTAALAWLRTAETMAWHRLRWHTIPHVLLLAEPASWEQAAVWLTAFAASGADRPLIAGPVDAEHLRLEPADWQARVAIALAALLWGRMSNPAALEAGRCWAIGGAAWPSPGAMLKRRLVAARALTAARQLAGDNGEPEAVLCDLLRPSAPSLLQDDSLPTTSTPPWQIPDMPLLAPERHRAELAARVPVPPGGELWRQHRPRGAGWLALPDLAQTLQTAVEVRMAAQRATQYEPRQQWVAEQVAAWETALAALHAQRLDTAGQWPAVDQLRREVIALRQDLQQALLSIEDWLETAEQAHAAANAAVERADQELRAICAAFPPLTSIDDILAALTRPWHWPGWAWAYLLLLPRHGQRLLDALGRQAQTRWHAANTHALRQAYLAMAQVTQKYQVTSERLARLLAEVVATLTADVPDAEVWTDVAPWTVERLAWLAAQLPAPVPPDLGKVLTATATDGPGPAYAGGADAGGSAAAIAAQLQAWAAASLAPLADWTAGDYLAAALPGPQLDAWLATFISSAQPLWPDQKPEEAEVWLLGPATQAGRADGLDDACRHEADRARHRGLSQADAVLAVQLLAVQLAAGS